VRSSKRAPSVTSLPRAPRDEADARVRHYMITMAIRVACFLLMVLITPYGWYTWVFAAGAVFLPYIAVVYANASQGGARGPVESPTLQLTTTAAPAAEPLHAAETITIEEHGKPRADVIGPHRGDEDRGSQ